MTLSQRSRRPKRLLHVTTTDISLVLLLGAQLRAFAAAGYDVVTASAPGPWVNRLREWGVGHHPLRYATRAFAPSQDARALLELRTLFRRLQPDVVHTHNPKPGLYGRVAARRARVPVVVNTVHGLYAADDDPWVKRAVVYASERLAATCSDAELVQNPEDLEVLRRLRVPADRLHLLGNGIDLTRFDPERLGTSRRAEVRVRLGIRADDVVCGVVGRLVWAKGYREVYEAARRLRDVDSSVRFVVVGPYDSKRDALTPEDVARAEREGRVIHLGLRDDMEELFSAFDVFVLASHREGFPRAAMEAAAMALPVIATDVRGGRQVVDDGITGRLVPVRQPSALAAAVTELAADAELRRRMGAAGRAKALREFDEQRVIHRTLRIYDHLLGQAGDKAHVE